MIKKNKLTTIVLWTSMAIFGQENNTSSPTQVIDATINDSVVKKTVRVSYLDSIKATFINDEMASCIDARWTQELVALDVYQDLLSDIKNVDPDVTVDYELPTELLKERLKLLDEKSPFNIEYNIGLENVIKSFLKNRKKGFERLMGISQFYFPIFEEELAKNNIPLEIKYLAVVESALNPLAVSRVGATGLWQFMYQTGKQYGLNITSYEDERSDPLKASQAASQYMVNMYKIFGDWDLVLASYNSGPGNVSKAIRRSGGQQNYWNIRKNLPKETQGYLPAFLATMYIFEYHKEHGIVPNKAIANHFATDTIMVKKHMTFKQVSDLLDISIDELKFYNPSYKRAEVPFVTGDANFLRLPKEKIAVFTSNEDKIYAYLAHEESKREKPNAISENRSDYATVKYHKVKKGDNLTAIATRYNVSEDDIKQWNGLKSSYLKSGRNLKIKMNPESKVVSDSSSVASNIVREEPTEIRTKAEYTYEKVSVMKDVVKYHTVKRGDNLGVISEKFDVSVSDIKKWNKIKGSNIQPGEKLKIIKNERVTSTVKKLVKKPQEIIASSVTTSINENHSEESVESTVIESASKTKYKLYTVKKKDNLSSIAASNHVTPEQIIEWNGLENGDIKAGMKLVVSFPNSDNTNVSNSKNVYHTVAKGEYLSTIAKKYNTTVEELTALNNLDSNGVMAGARILVSKKAVIENSETEKPKKQTEVANKKVKERIYQVKQGDSLFKISQKFPGVSVSDIKKWNNIKDENIKPGMKLKIQG